MKMGSGSENSPNIMTNIGHFIDAKTVGAERSKKSGRFSEGLRKQEVRGLLQPTLAVLNPRPPIADPEVPIIFGEELMNTMQMEKYGVPRMQVVLGPMQGATLSSPTSSDPSPAYQSGNWASPPLTLYRHRSDSPLSLYGHRSDPPVTLYGNRSDPPLTMYEHRSDPTLTLYEHRSDPPLTLYEHRSDPPLTLYEHRSNPPHNLYGHRSHPPLNLYEHRSDPPLTLYEHRSEPPVTLYGQRSDPPLTLYGHPSDPPLTLYGHRSDPSSLVYCNPNVQNPASPPYQHGIHSPPAAYGIGSGNWRSPGFGIGIGSSPVMGTGNVSTPGFGIGIGSSPVMGTGNVSTTGFGIGIGSSPVMGTGNVSTPGFSIGIGSNPVLGTGNVSPPGLSIGIESSPGLGINSLQPARRDGNGIDPFADFDENGVVSDLFGAPCRNERWKEQAPAWYGDGIDLVPIAYSNSNVSGRISGSRGLGNGSPMDPISAGFDHGPGKDLRSPGYGDRNRPDPFSPAYGHGVVNDPFTAALGRVSENGTDPFIAGLENEIGRNSLVNPGSGTGRDSVVPGFEIRRDPFLFQLQPLPRLREPLYARTPYAHHARDPYGHYHGGQPSYYGRQGDPSFMNVSHGPGPFAPSVPYEQAGFGGSNLRFNGIWHGEMEPGPRPLHYQSANRPPPGFARLPNSKFFGYNGFPNQPINSALFGPPGFLNQAGNVRSFPGKGFPTRPPNRKSQTQPRYSKQRNNQRQLAPPRIASQSGHGRGFGYQGYPNEHGFRPFAPPGFQQQCRYVNWIGAREILEDLVRQYHRNDAQIQAAILSEVNFPNDENSRLVEIQESLRKQFKEVEQYMLWLQM